jgi:hypothetical protein
MQGRRQKDCGQEDWGWRASVIQQSQVHDSPLHDFANISASVFGKGKIMGDKIIMRRPKFAAPGRLFCQLSTEPTRLVRGEADGTEFGEAAGGFKVVDRPDEEGDVGVV